MTLRQLPAPPLPRQQSGGLLLGGATGTRSSTFSSIEEETRSEMEIDANCENKKLIASIDSLPVDIVFFDILTRLGAQDIYNATRFVSRKWNQMIRTHSFIHTHLRHPTCGLLIQNSPVYSITLMEMRPDGPVEVSNFSYTSRHRYWSSSNGLILEWRFKDPYELVITNPVTRQHIALPSVPNGTQQPISLSAIAYAPNLMVYKVVRTCCNSEHGNPKPRKSCAILTVGTDKSWRLVDTKHLSQTDSEHFNITPLVTGGFVHWALGSSFVLTLDLETETISQFPVPRINITDGAHYFSTASYLSMLVVRGFFKWDVWEMKPETGEWTKLPEIDLEAQKCTFLQLCREHDISFKADIGCKLLPVGWLKYQEVLVFIVLKVFKARANGQIQSRLRIAYNVRTREFFWCESEPSFYPFLVHRNSLVWLD